MPDETLAVIAGVDLDATNEICGRAVYFVEPMAFAWSVINPFGILDGHSAPNGILVRYVEPHGWAGFDPASYPDCEFAIERIDADEGSAPVQNRAIALIATSPPCHHGHFVNRLIERLMRVARRHAIAHGFKPVRVIAVKVDAAVGEENHPRDYDSIFVNIDGLNHGEDLWKINSHIGETLIKTNGGYSHVA